MFDLPGSDAKSLKVTASYAQSQIDAQHDQYDAPALGESPKSQGAKTKSGAKPDAKAS
jgi:hypothetical protein